MKKICILIFCIFAHFQLYGQEEVIKFKNAPVQKTKRASSLKVRTPDSQKENLISHKASVVLGIKDFIGVSTSVEYERKINDKPIAWFGSLTIGDLDNYSPEENSEYSKDKVNLTFLHLGGGFHYYPLDYEAAFKPYIGLGGLIGGNRHYRDYTEDETNYISENSRGFDIGLSGIFGVRWGKGLIRCGLEYRVGYFHTKIFEDQISTDRHELSFLFSFQF